MQYILKQIKESSNILFFILLSFIFLPNLITAQTTLSQDFDGTSTGSTPTGWLITEGGSGTEGDDNNNVPVTGTTWRVDRPSSVGSSLSAPSSPKCLIVGKKDDQIAYDYFFSKTRFDNVQYDDEITVSFKKAAYQGSPTAVPDGWVYIYILEDVNNNGIPEPLGADASGLDSWNGYRATSSWSTTSEEISASGNVFIGIRAHIQKGILNTGNTYLMVDDLEIEYVDTPDPIQIVKPEGGEDWEAGSTQTIQWTVNDVSSVNIYYTKDGGNTTETIATNVNGSQGSYSWTIPNDPTSNCQVLISSSDIFDQAFALSNVFTISAGQTNPTITITEPNGGERYKVGTTQKIKWSSSNVINVKIWYDYGQGGEYITTSTPSDGEYTWTIPDRPGNYKMRVISTVNSNVYDESAGTFEIYEEGTGDPSITVLTPNGGEVLTGASTYNITWNSTYTDQVSINLLKDDAFYHNIIATMDNTGSYIWNVPDDPGNYKIEVRDPTYKQTNDRSDAEFTIIADPRDPSITIYEPQGGERIHYTDDLIITWASVKVDEVDIYYLRGTTKVRIVDNYSNSGEYTWDVVNIMDTYKIIIEDSDDPSIADTSSQFEVYNKYAANIWVESPNGGEQLHNDSTYTITWTCYNVENVTIKIEKPGYSVSLAQPVSCSDGLNNYQWTVDEDPGTEYTIGVYEYNTTDGAYDVSDDVFSIIGEEKKITVLKPNGGEVYEVDSVMTFNWSVKNVDTVDIHMVNSQEEILIDEGRPFNHSSNLKYNVPKKPGQWKIRIRDNKDHGIFDLSDGYFTIEDNSKSIHVTTPNTDTYTIVGRSQTIRWESTNVDSVDIFLVNDNTNYQIADNVYNEEFYVWEVIDQEGEFKIRVEDFTDKEIFDESDEFFKITDGFIDSLGPLLSVDWKTYSWPLNAYFPEDANGINGHIGNACGPTAMAKIMTRWQFPPRGKGSLEFTDDFGNRWSADFGTSGYDYDKMPSSFGQNPHDSIYHEAAELMYHAAVAMHDVYGSGRSLHDIMNAMQEYFYYSDEAEIHYRGDYTRKEWQDLLQTELSAGRPVLIEGWTENSTPPGQIGNHEGHYFVIDGYNRKDEFHVVYNYGDMDGYYDLDNFEPYNAYNWIITGLEPGDHPSEIDVVSPSGGEYLVANTVKKIAWTYNEVDSVKIEYSVDHGYNFKTIVEAMPASAGFYNWRIPEDYSSEVYVRVSDVEAPSIDDFNSGKMEILPNNNFSGLYTPDENTVLLLHFDDTYSDDSPSKSGGTAYGEVSFDESVNEASGKSLRIDNSGDYKSCVIIPESDDLNLSGDWTIEAWIKVNSYGSSFASYPFIIVKPGANAFYEANYSLQIGADMFRGEFFDTNTQAVYVTSGSTKVTLNEWIHIAYVRDSSNNTLKLIGHNADGELVFEREYNYGAGRTPLTNSSDLHIGGFNNSSNAQFDGWIDEVRISDVIREFNSASGSIELLNLNGGEIVAAGKPFTIQWQAENIDYVNIEGTINNGANWWSIADSVDAGLGSYSWDVYNTDSERCKVRVTCSYDKTISAISNEMFTISTAVDVHENISYQPDEYNLSQNYPNPFNPSTVIRYNVPEANNVLLEVYDLLGQRVAVLVDGFKTAGSFEVVFDASNLQTGVYFYRMISGDFVSTKKLVLMK